jgi:hypothetical protein
VGVTGSASYPVKCFGNSGVEFSCSATRLSALIFSFLKIIQEGRIFYDE